MAILKHIAIKNADYGEAQRYLIFQYQEFTKKPIRNEQGKPILREEYYLDGIHCNPFTFDIECKELNTHFHKNQTVSEIKLHHYIISFDPKDREENGLTGERAQQLGLEYARKNFPGHQILVCTHTDGQNGSGNIHVHIILNSLRKYDVEPQDFMERSCDYRAGYKHHLTKNYLIHLKQSLMDLCHREHLHQVELLTPAKTKVAEKEYWLNRQEQEKLEKRNRQMIEDGVTPRVTKFQTQKEFLRCSIEKAVCTACSLEEFQQILFEKYHILCKVSRGRLSYLHPDRSKPITGRSLGTLYEKDSLLKQIEENAKAKEMEKSSLAQNDSIAKQNLSPRYETSTAEEDFLSILSIQSKFHLVIDLQHCMKAQQSIAYAQKVKLSNLKEMAKTIAYVQEHGYDTRESLEQALSEAKEKMASFKKELKMIEDKLREQKEQIHYTGQYLANKSVYTQFCHSKKKGLFRQEHSAEIALYETAVKFLKEKSGNGKLPSLTLLREEKEKLIKQKSEKQMQYHHSRNDQKELSTICSNVDRILAQPCSYQSEPQKEHTIS